MGERVQMLVEYEDTDVKRADIRVKPSQAVDVLIYVMEMSQSKIIRCQN